MYRVAYVCVHLFSRAQLNSLFCVYDMFMSAAFIKIYIFLFIDY